MQFEYNLCKLLLISKVLFIHSHLPDIITAEQKRRRAIEIYNLKRVGQFIFTYYEGWVTFISGYIDINCLMGKCVRFLKFFLINYVLIQILKNF